MIAYRFMVSREDGSWFGQFVYADTLELAIAEIRAKFPNRTIKYRGEEIR